MDVTLHLILGYLNLLLCTGYIASKGQTTVNDDQSERIQKEAVVTYTVRAILWRDHQSPVCNSKPERLTHEALTDPSIVYACITFLHSLKCNVGVSRQTLRFHVFIRLFCILAIP
jgi:hypothetical protein